MREGLKGSQGGPAAAMPAAPSRRLNEKHCHSTAGTAAEPQGETETETYTCASQGDFESDEKIRHI